MERVKGIEPLMDKEVRRLCRCVGRRAAFSASSGHPTVA